jgi:hypothetical protein
MSGERLGIGRACPRCGVRSDTLGTICPACKRPYAAGGLLERLRAARLLVALAPLLVAGWVWLIITNVVAGILIAAAAFVALVAAIGVANALTDRGR